MIAIYLSPLYLALNIFILIKLMRWLHVCAPATKNKGITILICSVFLFVTFSILIAFLLPPGLLQRILKLLSNYWLGSLVYITLFLLCYIIIHRLYLFIRFKHRSDIKNALKLYKTSRLYKAAGGIILFAVVFVVGFGIYHSHDIQVNDYDITVSKEAGKLDELNVVLLADLHMGYNVGCNLVQQIVDKTNAQNPDIVLIAGDIFDNEYEALDDPDRLAEILGSIKSKYGVYAVYGNHDINEKILGGFTFDSKEKVSDPKMDELLEKANITLLTDETRLIDDSFYIVGRVDIDRPGRGITKRKTASELIENLDQSKPVIILNHEPKELEEDSKSGADIELCGHVHDGQLFPGNLFVRLEYTNACGYRQYGNMHSIVTSGCGIWGPAMRVGTDSEICNIKIHFQ